MKHDDLRAIAHNVAASLASGISFLIGYYELDVYEDASRSPTGMLVIDFLRGTVEPCPSEGNLGLAAAKFPSILSAFCEKHGVTISAFREMEARYWAKPQGGCFTVRITDQCGRRSETDYGGYNGQRIRVLDDEGRVRPIPVRSVEARA